MPQSLLPKMQHMDITPVLHSYRAGLNDGQEEAKQNLLRRVGQTAAEGGLGEASKVALAGGDVNTGIKLQELSIDRQAKFYDFAARGAAAADTPEKWSQYIGVLGKTFGAESVKGFENFSARESAIALSMSALEKANLKLREQSLALQRDASARAERNADRSHSLERERFDFAKQQATRKDNPTFGVIGEDPMTGAKNYGWINPANQTTAPAIGPAQGGPAAGASGGPGSPGGPEIPTIPFKPTDSEKTDLSKATVSYKVLDKELQNYGELVKKRGVSILPGTEARTAYDVSRRNIQLQMKELYNLGVLNGPDLALMNQMLVDPTTQGSGDGGVTQAIYDTASAPVKALYKAFTLQGAAKVNIDMLRESMKSIYEAKRDVVMRKPSAQKAEPEKKRLKFNPQTGNLE